MIVYTGPIRWTTSLLSLPPTLRTAIYKTQCNTTTFTRLASTAQRTKAVKPKSQPAPYKPSTEAKTADKARPGAYASFIDNFVSRQADRNQPILLYKAPPHANYYAACGFMSFCFAVATLGCASTISAGYEMREELWWQLPLLGIATGGCALLFYRTASAPRKLIHEMWLLPRPAGAGASAPRLVEIKCRAWPLPMGRDRTWTAPLEDISLSRTYGSAFYRASPERGGRHNIASDTAKDAAEMRTLLADEQKSDGVIITRLVAGVDRCKKIFQECKQVMQWSGINAWVVVEGKGSFRMDGRGLMLQGGKGLDMLFRQYNG